MYPCRDMEHTILATSFAHACHSLTCLSGGLAACSWRGVSCAGRGRHRLSARVPAHPSSRHTHPSLLSCNAVCFVVVACYDVAAVSVCIMRCVLLSSHACSVAAISVCIIQCVLMSWRARSVAAVSICIMHCVLLLWHARDVTTVLVCTISAHPCWLSCTMSPFTFLLQTHCCSHYTASSSHWSLSLCIKLRAVFLRYDKPSSVLHEPGKKFQLSNVNKVRSR